MSEQQRSSTSRLQQHALAEDLQSSRPQSIQSGTLSYAPPFRDAQTPFPLFSSMSHSSTLHQSDHHFGSGSLPHSMTSHSSTRALTSKDYCRSCRAWTGDGFHTPSFLDEDSIFTLSDEVPVKYSCTQSSREEE